MLAFPLNEWLAVVNEKQRSHVFGFVGCVFAVVTAGYLAWTYFPAGGNDDSYISYWAAYALSKYGRLINYNGESIEQSSSLLQVLVLAVARKLFGWEPHHAGPVASILAGALTFPAVIWACRVGQIKSAFGAVLLLSVCVSFTYWSTSGMESSLAALVSVLAIVTVSRCIDSPRSTGLGVRGLAVVVLLACAIVRPETPLVLLVSLIGLSVVRLGEVVLKRANASSVGLKEIAKWSGLLAFMVALLMEARTLAFGSAFPNPAVSKTGGFDFPKGLDYLLGNVKLNGMPFGFLVLAGLLVVLAGAVRRRVKTVPALATLFAVVQIGFVCSSGGDWMPAGRLLVPAMPMFVLVAGFALDSVSTKTRLGAVGLVVILFVSGVKATVEFGKSGSNSSLPSAYVHSPTEKQLLFSKYDTFEVFSKGHRRDAWLLESLIPAIRSRLAGNHRPFTLMSGQAGMVPYYVFREYFGKGQFVDLFSLTSRRHLPCLPKGATRPMIHGIQVLPQAMLDHEERLVKCGVTRPDIWFSTGKVPDLVVKKGFRVVYVSRPGEDKAWAAMTNDVTREML